MKLRHKLGIAFIVLAAAAGGAVFWLWSSLDSIVKQAIETYGPEITQVSVQVGAVRLAPTDGMGAISALRLGNPKGFKTESAVKIGEISLQIDPASLTRDVIVLREVVLRAPEISYETGDAGNNLEQIQKNIEAYVARHSEGKAQDSGPKKKLIIENLYIRDARVNFNTPLTLGKTLSSPLPDMHLRDIGKKSNGTTAGDAAKQVWQSLLRSATGAASRAGGAIKEGAKSLIEGGKKLFGK